VRVNINGASKPDASAPDGIETISYKS